MASSPSVSDQYTYDVFLSFRGEDTRTTFVDHLYAALARNGIRTFLQDDKEKSNSSLKEIEESRFAIVIFSKSYASSSWCLDELVKIMECSKTNGQLVLPVYYYDFDPANLRRQGPVFGELFAKFEMEKVRAWTSVLVEAANLNGLGLIDDRYQAKHINEIVETVLSKLDINNIDYYQNEMRKKRDTLGDTSSSHEQLIGIDHRVQEVKKWLQEETVKTASNPELASSSTRSSWWTYDVFLSFKANDTCKEFVDQLHYALKQNDIYAVRNDQALARVESIDAEHLKAIEESYIAVVVFSNNYASSSSCLDELVKIMNCSEGFGQMVFPVFYKVESSDVRNQKGLFGEVFLQNQSEKIEIWRNALVKACSLAGWYLNCSSNSDEAMVIESVVDVISRRLKSLHSSVDDNLIGIEKHMKHVLSQMKLGSGGVRMLGIYGMGGIGKTTLARAIFDQVSTCFDGSWFAENVREVSKSHGLGQIQREVFPRLLEDKGIHARSKYEGVDPRVLLVLDDVDDVSQLEALVGSDNSFGEGSRIIITTRDESLLVARNIMQTYYVKPLDVNESYKFLRRHAFKKDESTKAYEEDLFPKVVSYAAGLPLALKVLSSRLRGRSRNEWTSTLARLKVIPEKAIHDTLKISYDGLNAVEKELFLDIACFFNHKKKDYAVKILDSCGFVGDIGIRRLERKSLMSVLKGRISMHDLVQEMGRNIVRQEDPDEPEKRSRLWRAEEVLDILTDGKSMKKVDAIVVDDMHEYYDYDFGYDAIGMTKALRSMKKLRLLQIHSPKKLRFLKECNYLPNKLRWLTWERYPFQSLPTSFKGKKLVGLELIGSSMSEAWHGKKSMETLRFLNLSYCDRLIKTPDFSGTPTLEELYLESCTRLFEVHKSIGHLKRLTMLNLRSCETLEALPGTISKLKSLKYLDLIGCSKLTYLPSLPVISIDLAIDLTIKVPSSIDFLSNLVEVDLSTLRNWGIPYLKLRGSVRLHDTLLYIVQRSNSSNGKTLHEVAEYKEQNISLLQGRILRIFELGYKRPVCGEEEERKK